MQGVIAFIDRECADRVPVSGYKELLVSNGEQLINVGRIQKFALVVEHFQRIPCNRVV